MKTDHGYEPGAYGVCRRCGGERHGPGSDQYSYTIARFDPATTDPALPMQTRVIVAESEDAAYKMMAEPIDGSYWQIIDTNDPAVRL